MASRVPGQQSIRMRDALVSLFCVLFVIAAVDDITTDHATDFTVEYSVLVLCSAWFAYIAVKLTRIGHRALGILSFGALAGAAWGQRALGPGMTPGRSLEYLTIAGAIVWFLALTAGLFLLGWRDFMPSRRGRSRRLTERRNVE